MKLNKEVIIVGGFPSPIGGVTSFLYRLVHAYPQFVLEFIDLYFSESKEIPQNFRGKYQLLPSKFRAFLYILFSQFRYKEKEYFFNFSTGNSLIFFLFLPKIRNDWSLMLHHGYLESKLPNFILKFILNKFDRIYALNYRQADFFKKNFYQGQLINEKSYVPAVLIDIDEQEKEPLNNAKINGFKVIIGSGAPTSIYQHHLLIELIEQHPNTYLFLFLYGNGNLKDKLINYKHPRVKIFYNKKESIFNYYLANSNVYIRPTLEDSFGIACADAIEFGIKVIASDVCPRYQGVSTYSVLNNEKLNEIFKEKL